MNNYSIETIVGSIGEKMLRCRKEQGLTLNQLAQEAGVSAAAIHKIEKSEMTPSITVLMKIARALNKEIGFFVEENKDLLNFKEKVEVVRKGYSQELVSPTGAKMEIRSMFLEDGQLEACIFTFRPGTASGDSAKTHKGEEFFLVLEGEMSFCLEQEIFILKEGDSIHFNSKSPHKWENSGDKDLKLLWVMTPLPLSSIDKWIP
jgi:transcriptional regulator with XRE-family HTH domain